MSDFINHEEVPDLTQDELTDLLRRRAAEGQSLTQVGDMFGFTQMLIALETVSKEFATKNQAVRTGFESNTDLEP